MADKIKETKLNIPNCGGFAVIHDSKVLLVKTHRGNWAIRKDSVIKGK
jgi:hypothetical protein